MGLSDRDDLLFSERDQRSSVDYRSVPRFIVPAAPGSGARGGQRTDCSDVSLAEPWPAADAAAVAAGREVRLSSAPCCGRDWAGRSDRDPITEHAARRRANATAAGCGNRWAAAA